MFAQVPGTFPKMFRDTVTFDVVTKDPTSRLFPVPVQLQYDPH